MKRLTAIVTAFLLCILCMAAPFTASAVGVDTYHFNVELSETLLNNLQNNNYKFYNLILLKNSSNYTLYLVCFNDSVDSSRDIIYYYGSSQPSSSYFYYSSPKSYYGVNTQYSGVVFRLANIQEDSLHGNTLFVGGTYNNVGNFGNFIFDNLNADRISAGTHMILASNADIYHYDGTLLQSANYDTLLEYCSFLSYYGNAQDYHIEPTTDDSGGGSESGGGSDSDDDKFPIRDWFNDEIVENFRRLYQPLLTIDSSINSASQSIIEVLEKLYNCQHYIHEIVRDQIQPDVNNIFNTLSNIYIRQGTINDNITNSLNGLKTLIQEQITILYDCQHLIHQSVERIETYLNDSDIDKIYNCLHNYIHQSVEKIEDYTAKLVDISNDISLIRSEDLKKTIEPDLQTIIEWLDKIYDRLGDLSVAADVDVDVDLDLHKIFDDLKLDFDIDIPDFLDDLINVVSLINDLLSNSYQNIVDTISLLHDLLSGDEPVNITTNNLIVDLEEVINAINGVKTAVNGVQVQLVTESDNIIESIGNATFYLSNIKDTLSEFEDSFTRFVAPSGLFNVSVISIIDSIDAVPESIRVILEDLFIPDPDSNSFIDLIDMINDKFYFVHQLYNIFRSYGEHFESIDFSTTPDYTFDFNSELLGNFSVNVLDLSVIQSYQVYMHMLTGGVATYIFLRKLRKRLPSVINGTADMRGETLTI